MVIIPDDPVDFNKGDDPEHNEMEGSLSNSMDDKNALLKSILEADTDSVDDGKVLNEMLNQGLQSFQPDLAFSQLVQNYKNAEQIYGDSLLSAVSGYDSQTIQRNIHLPEFQRDLKSKMHAKAKEFRLNNYTTRDGEILDKGIQLAAISMFVNELEHLEAKGLLGEYEHKERSHYGSRTDPHRFHAGDRYKDIAIRDTIKLAIRRGHKKLSRDDLYVSSREAKGKITLIYAIDASGSMRGKKIAMAKRAGVALAHKATSQNDEVGLMVFADEVKHQVRPTTEFFEILDGLSQIRASQQTNIAQTIEHSLTLFETDLGTKHLILLTDAETTVGDDPQDLAFEAATKAAASGVSISLIGISLDEQTAEFGRKLTELGNGKLYLVDNTSTIDMVVLQDYESLMH